MIKQKVLTLLVLLMTAVSGAWAETITVKYALKAGDTFTSGQTVEVKNDAEEVVATITYGESGGRDFNEAKDESNVSGYTAYTDGNGTNGSRAGGTFYTITPKVDATITVAVALNRDKKFYIEEDGMALADYNGITVSADYHGTYEFDATANKAYKVYCASSKLGFYGFAMTYSPVVPVTDPATKYNLTLADGTDDADKWQGKAGEGEYQALPLEGVAAGTAVTVKYFGTKKVESVKAVKKAAPAPARTLAEATAEDLGKVVGADGNIYDDAAAATAVSTTAVAVIAYVGIETYDATFKNGLAIALADEGSKSWSTAESTCEGKTAITGAKWCLPSKDQWKQMFKANGGNEGSYTGLNNALAAAGGESSKLQEWEGYWSSSLQYEDFVWIVIIDDDGPLWDYGGKDGDNNQVRACLAF